MSSIKGRIGYVLKMYPRFSETFIVNEILAHEAAGLELEIFSLRPPNDGRFHEALARVRAPVTYLPSSRPRITQFWQLLRTSSRTFPHLWAACEGMFEEKAEDIQQALLLAHEVRARGITHLHAHFGSVATTVTRLAARLTDLPYTFTAHAKDIYHESVQPDDLYRKLSDAAAVITVSKFNQAYLYQKYNLPPHQIHCIYNGLDLDQFPYQSPLNRPARIVAVGRLVEKKGFADLIDACKRLADQGRSFEAEIVGKGPLEGELQAQIERLGLTERVKLVGPRPQGEVKGHVQGAAVFAAPCVIGQDGNRDGLPTVLLEAMALGTPCVSTDVTGIPEVVRDGITGLCLPQRSPSALADALARLLDDSMLRVRLAAQARQLIEAEFNIRRNTAHIRDLFAAAQTAATPLNPQEMSVDLDPLYLEVA